MSKHCGTCRCFEAYDGWADLQSQYPGVSTIDELKVAVREAYEREHPGKWARCTSDEAVALAVSAFGPYIRERSSLARS